MFTGIVEEIGTVKKIARGQKAYLEIQADRIFSDIHIGDSIAVNGVCLTVTGFSGKVFTADVMNETFSRSSLGSLKAGSHVNLERAMSANGRFGGHIVSGHIDGTGKIINIKKDGNAVWYKISADENIIKYTVEKGSIAIDGISLTVARIEKDNFSVKLDGEDYDTEDGTGVRDYIHIMDLAKAHINGLKKLENDKNGMHIYNLGTGKGVSVLEMINTFEKVNNVKINYKITERRPGDIAVCYADPTKAFKELNWKAIYNLEDMCRDAYNYVTINK